MVLTALKGRSLKIDGKELNLRLFSTHMSGRISMKIKLLTILFLTLFISPSFANHKDILGNFPLNCNDSEHAALFKECKKRKKKPKKVINNITNQTIVQSEHNAYDYGAYLHLILFETKNTEWGALNTFLYEDNEFRTYVGGKIYLNRLFKKK